MPIPKLATALGAMLLSKGGRRLAGRHAGKLALATMAWQLYQQHKSSQGVGNAGDQGTSQGGRAQPHPRQRWSGRKP